MMLIWNRNRKRFETLGLYQSENDPEYEITAKL